MDVLAILVSYPDLTTPLGERHFGKLFSALTTHDVMAISDHMVIDLL